MAGGEVGLPGRPTRRGPRETRFDHRRGMLSLASDTNPSSQCYGRVYMTWSSPLGVDMGPSDQWFPSVAVDPVTGQVGVLYNDRDPSNPHLYDASLTVETAVGPVKTIVSAELSDPTNPSSSERTCRDANTAPSSKATTSRSRTGPTATRTWRGRT